MLLVIAIAFGPFIGYVCLLLFSAIQERINSRFYPVKPICTSAACIRCAKNLAAFSRAKTFFNDVYNASWNHKRLRKAFNRPGHDAHEPLLFQMPELTSKSLWTTMDLGVGVAEDVAKLEDAHAMITLACLRALKNPTMWRRNQEANSCWFVFPLLNQGTWQDEYCAGDEDLMNLIHSLRNTMHNCAFGNIFFSMLPAKTVIETHRGPTNMRLRCHLALEVPKDPASCFLTVDEQITHWEEGRCFVFDDSKPHSVDSTAATEDRLALVVDFWHPEVTEAERYALRRAFPAVD